MSKTRHLTANLASPMLAEADRRRVEELVAEALKELQGGEELECCGNFSHAIDLEPVTLPEGVTFNGRPWISMEN